MRKFLLISLVAFGFLYSWAARAEVRGAETFIRIDKAQNLKTYFVLYRETQNFVVDEYRQQGADFQQRVSQKKFFTEPAAREYVAQFSVETGATTGADENGPITELDGEVLWVADKEWSQDWELAYADWMQSEVDANFHKRFGIATDCADVAISLRWIFARIHKLPMASSLAGSRRLFTNETVLRAWVNLPTAQHWYDDRRFIAALDYVLNNTFTHSLMADSYPVAITPEHFTPGVHHLDLYEVDTGHTRMINKISRELGAVEIIESTVPRKLRTLSFDYYQDYSGIENLDEGGFLKIRWVEKTNGVWRLRLRNAMPGYSLEQYKKDFSDAHERYFQAVLARLDLNMSPSLQMQNLLNRIEEKLEARVAVVREGYEYCRTNNCEPGSPGYEAWSTPHRDRVIKELYLYASELESKHPAAAPLYESFMEQIWTVEDVSKERSRFLMLLTNGWATSDPRDPPRRRWGLSQSPHGTP